MTEVPGLLATARASVGDVGWWRLEETTGTVAADDTYQGDGTYLGGLTLNGAAGVVFDGTSGRVETAWAYDIAGYPFTMVARIKAGPAGAVRTLISKGPGGLVLRLNATNTPEVAVGGGAVLLTSTAALDAAEHVVCAIFDNTIPALILYVDGGETKRVTSPAGMPTAVTTPWTLGAYIDAGGVRSAFFNGTMLDAALWRKAFTGTPAYVWAVPDWYYRVPTILTAWRDPAAPTAPIVAELPINAIAAGSPMGSIYIDTAYPPGTALASGAVANITNSRGLWSVTVPGVAANMETTTRAFSPNQQTVNGVGPVTSPALFALPRLTPNIALGNAPSGLAVALAMIPPDQGVAYVRAATGPNPTDYAPGSSWVLASAAGSIALPATNAYLAVQLQLVRQSPKIGSLLERVEALPVEEV